MVSVCACSRYIETVSARRELPQVHGLMSAKIDGYALSRAPPLYVMMWESLWLRRNPPETNSCMSNYCHAHFIPTWYGAPFNFGTNFSSM